MANDGYGLLNAWEAMEFQEEGQRNLFNYRGGQTVNHAQFGSIGKDGTGHLTMPYAIKPAGYSKEQIISQYGSIAAWEAYKDNGENTWSRSAYYQMLEDGYSEEEARAGTNWYDEVVQTGKVQDHQISITGGGEKATYSVGLGYMNREGTIKESWFRRYSLRANTNFFVNKWFNIGQNTNIAVIENSGERGRQGDDNTFGKTFSINLGYLSTQLAVIIPVHKMPKEDVLRAHQCPLIMARTIVVVSYVPNQLSTQRLCL